MNAHPLETVSSPDVAFAAHADERLYAAAAAPAGGRARRAAVGAAALIYALLVGAVLYETRFPPPEPEAEETPVEIVVAPPPEPPAPTPTPTPTPTPPQPQPSAPPKPLDIAPAYDAPKESEQKTVDSAAADSDHKPPPAPPAEDVTAQRVSGLPQPLASPSPAPAAPAPSRLPDAPSPETPPAPLSEQGEAPPPKAAAQPAPPKPSPSNPAPAPSATPNARPAAGKPTPLFDSAPDLDFGGANMAAPVAGGNSRATYTAILVGLFRKHVHVPAGLAPRRVRGTVAFTIDASGRLINRWISESSGAPEMDAAAFDAVGASSPFPPPPPGTVGVGAWLIRY